MVKLDVGVKMRNRVENLGFRFIIDGGDEGRMENELGWMWGEEKKKVGVRMVVRGM